MTNNSDLLQRLEDAILNMNTYLMSNPEVTAKTEIEFFPLYKEYLECYNQIASQYKLSQEEMVVLVHQSFRNFSQEQRTILGASFAAYTSAPMIKNASRDVN